MTRVDVWVRVGVLSIGGALGVNARFWLGLWMNRWVGPQFPWATFAINVSGSFAIGFLTAALTRWLPHPHIRLLVLVGFLGGYTTFSTFALESLTLWERGSVPLALANTVGSVVAGVLAAALGVLLARALVVPEPQHEAAPAAAPRAALPERATRLRLFIPGGRHKGGEPNYQALVSTVRGQGLAGASVFAADLSFGAHHYLHDIASDYSFPDLPVIVEIIDAPERLDALITDPTFWPGAGFATVETVRVFNGLPTQRSEGLSDPTSPIPRSIAMPDEGPARRLTIYVGSSDTWHGRNLAVEIVEHCRRLGLAGATASRGIMGFGENSRIHRAHLLGLSEDLPERIEIVDHPDRIAEVLPTLAAMVQGGLILLDDVRVVRPGGRPAEGAS